MKKIFILLSLIILGGCSFQVRESDTLEERLSRGSTIDRRDIYSEFNVNDGDFIDIHTKDFDNKYDMKEYE